ncbi:putative mitochondrial 2-oxoglutarate/malate carrier protein [Diplonema papillatum]|nr:putative mitochondrial 2-oxoglutarate/malate carrier protein [Diplonema papillatum]
MAAKSSPPPPLSPSVTFGSAGLGGVGAWWLVHPFNTIAVRMSLANASGGDGKIPVKENMFKFTSKIVKAEGVGSLYKGIGAGTLRQVFYATSRFGLFETFRDFIASKRDGKVDFTTRIVAGAAGGACAAFISCPAEVSLVRMANDSAQPADKRRNYKNVVDAFRRISSEEGIGAFWRGSTPFITRCVIVGCFQVGTYDQFKQYFSKSLELPINSVANVAISANLASLIYSFVTMPLETSKNRMAFQRPDPVTGQLPYRSIVQTLNTVIRVEGVRALWNGYFPYYGRCGGHTVGMFILVEEIRRQYRNYYDLW